MADERDLVEVTITETRRSRLPWRGRVVTGRSEYLLTTGEALHAAEVLDARGARDAADNLRAVVLKRILEPDLSHQNELIDRLIRTNPEAEGLPPPRPDAARADRPTARLRKRLFK